jgi:hypothetical protein
MIRKLLRIGLLLCFTPMVILVDFSVFFFIIFHKMFDFIDGTKSKDPVPTEWLIPEVMDKVKSIWTEV